MKNRRTQKGFSLIELLVAVAILMIVAGTVIAGMINTTRSESTVINRTQVHASVRNATELMEQEIGQAGRLPAVSASTPLTVQFATAVAASALGTVQTPTITSTAGLFVGEQITVDPNSTNEETVTISAIAGNTVTAKFYNAHTTAVIPVMILGGFASGIVPPDSSSMFVLKSNGATNTPLTTQASTGSILKLYGDLKSDGNTYYVVYKCTQDQNGQGTLYRYESNTTDINTATAMNTGVLLLDNLGQNPGNTPCFTYQVKEPFVTINGGQVQQTFVVNVAVTLTVQTQDRDAKTGQFQKETKALLNISPRNVFDAWELVSAPTGYTRAQPMPDNVFSTLLTANMTP